MVVYCGIFATFSFLLETIIIFCKIVKNYYHIRKFSKNQKFLTKYILNFSLFRHINKSEHHHQHELVLLTMNVQNSSVCWKCKRALFITNCVTVCILVSLTSFGKCHGLVWPCVPFGWDMSRVPDSLFLEKIIWFWYGCPRRKRRITLFQLGNHFWKSEKVVKFVRIFWKVKISPNWCRYLSGCRSECPGLNKNWMVTLAMVCGSNNVSTTMDFWVVFACMWCICRSMASFAYIFHSTHTTN